MLRESGKRHEGPQKRDEVPKIPGPRHDHILKGKAKAERIGAIMDLSRRLEDGKVTERDAKDALSQALDDDDKDVRWNAVYVLSSMGACAIPELRNVLRSEDAYLRKTGAAMTSAMLMREKQVLHPDAEMKGLAQDLVAVLGNAEHAVFALEELARVDPVSVIAVIDGAGAGGLEHIHAKAAGAIREMAKKRQG